MNAISRRPRRLLPSALSLALLAAFPPMAWAADPGTCTTADSVSGAGPWPSGIARLNLGANHVLSLFDLTAPVLPIPGTAGIRLGSFASANLTLCTGAALAPVRIGSTGASAIVLSSVGRPPAPSGTDPLFHIVLPGGPDAQGGTVRVVNRMDVETTGDRAHGIVATSTTLGYGSDVTDPLRDYDESRVGFRVETLATPEGSAVAAGGSVAARVVNALPDGADKSRYLRSYGAEAGRFSVDAEGNVSFTMSAQDFEALDLAVGETVVVTADLVLQGLYQGSVAGPQENGRVSAQITRDAGNQPVIVATWADFDTFGQADLAAPGAKALPSVHDFLQARLAEAEGSGGGGGHVVVEHLAGVAPDTRDPPLARISTQGTGAHGIDAESHGIDGIAGRNGGGFWSFGFIPPGNGTPGRNGGTVEVVVDGAIETRGDGSAGVFARSTGGLGGNGGDGGTYYYGRAGAQGGNGGEVGVAGSGWITTHGRSAPGIFAFSEGGNGGNGGGGDIFTGGGVGSSGGISRKVEVTGRWDIETWGVEAHGIWAKSTGGRAGSGGSGGWLYGAPKPGASATDGGEVKIESGGTVTTHEAHAFALFGQSVGGFGGVGGSDLGLFSSQGGSGGSAGSGGDVSVANTATGRLETRGEGSHALVAQSVGGGGGAGGAAFGIIARGGIGAFGGNGGDVTASNAGAIDTHGVAARGLFAQSVGGGGGDGGAAVGLLAEGGAGGGIGGIGSGFSTGGTVTVDNSGRIETRERGAQAIFAQSVGGGGGNGGASAGWRSVGGDGGSGGDAGAVQVRQSGTLVTHASGATAVFAQSVGGGGGTGGASIAVGVFDAYALGGKGSLGGVGNDVTVDSSAGAITTGGTNAHGIFAQSVGGGGGDGGFAMASTGSPLVGLSLAVGGKAGPGGDAGEVEVTNRATITTQASDSIGLFAESVGGGGGNGGYAISGATGGLFAASFALGGSGATGGVGRRTSVDNGAAITTAGARSTGLQAQSIGGGGGNGGFSLGVAAGGLAALTMTLGGSAGSGGGSGEVDVDNRGAITTDGVGAHAVFVQSVGGGGGSGGFSVGLAAGGFAGGSLSLGGKGNGGGNAGLVDVDNAGRLETRQADAVGLFAQSVGGGGGNGGFAISAAGSIGAALTMALGGSGAGGGAASTVDVHNRGAIVTRGRSSVGLQAQSVGGGGGNGGFGLTVSGGGLAGFGAALGGQADEGGNGQAVKVWNDGRIDTLGRGGAQAHAMLVQSVGGGGGNGGFSIGVTGGGFGAGTLSLGGGGGGGGRGGTVWVQNTGALATTQFRSAGLLAQSVGGGGGNGGFALSGAASNGITLGLTLGGSGDTGGVGERVDVINRGTIHTGGDQSVGLQAQSLGGGGGNGGFALDVGAGTLARLGLTMGGAGAGGGAAAVVSVDNHAGIDTAGSESHALFAQSLGGGGGNGGFAVTLGAGGLVSGDFALGGSADGGGAGGLVEVSNAGALQTRRPGSVGLYAQSVGGGGGNGGFAISGGTGAIGSLQFALGGRGGGGGAGAKVVAGNSGTIRTAGAGSIGLQAQSLGGGGGNGGFSIAAGAGGLGTVGITLGGSAGAGGGSGGVHVENTGAIATDGADAHAMFVQSVGGGGGNGGFSIAAGQSIAGAAVVLGGDGGGGGTPGAVYAKNTAALSTAQAGSVGLFAQSVGGGGGKGGFAIGAVVGQGGSVGFTLGGSGAGGGTARTVTVDNRGAITTRADRSIGLQAQSIGGGGGNGGFSVGLAGGGLGALNVSLGGAAAGGGEGRKVDARNRAVITTQGAESHAIFAQSVGGGGGNGGFVVGLGAGGTAAGTVALGGSGGGGGAGGEVLVINSGALTTKRDQAVGLFAQSVGGGGGNGGFSISGAGAGTGALAFGLGGSGDVGGAGHRVTVTSLADIGTAGADAHGIFAQSVGGGGGNGGFAIAVSGAGTASASIAIAGSGDGGGAGRQVSVTQGGRIETRGDNAIGVFAQSVGGGGGNGGFSIAAGGAGTASGALTLGGSGDAGGSGGTVGLHSDGPIVTHGARAFGLAAQSVGGGGGNGGFAIGGAGAGTGAGAIVVGGGAGEGGAADAVTLASAGAVTTHGEGAVGLFAQSVGGGGGNGGFAFGGSLGTRLSLTVAVGGAGGTGGLGRAVDVDSLGAVETAGAGAHAIQAQSVGGGGGNGGMAAALGIGSFSKSGLLAEVTVGGGGGSGGTGGDVAVGSTARVGGTLTTHGDGANGIFAQSVGGGGGQGGAALGLSFSNDVKIGKGSKAVTANLNFGGRGGDGNRGGAVAVDNASAIGTAGANAHGIFAQSVGGGGGSNGGAETIALSTSELLPFKETQGDSYGLEITAGGNAGRGHRGGTVTVTNAGRIVTSGSASRGIFAQSIGGGGGSVTEGITGRVGDWVDTAKNVLGAVEIAQTLGGFFTQGDAGGLVPSSLSITLGANEGSGADADAVKVVNRADIGTLGLGAHAIFAQSVGAGGGDAKAYAEGRGGGQSVATGVGLLGEFVVGGAGGAAGSGGRVDLDHAGTLRTRGAQAHGIFAQSVGGGGGAAGSVAGGFSGLDSIGLGIGFGRSGGSGGEGGEVAVRSRGSIETRGERAIGIVAQSVGGGGGSAGSRSGLAFFGSVGGVGRGGPVSVVHDGDILTEGARAHAILAQSAGGASGSVSSGGVTTSYLGGAGSVAVTVRDGSVQADGEGADGILAQSIGSGGGGQAIRVTVDAAAVRGGRGAAAGVRLLDGAANLIVNQGGWITSHGGIDGDAIVATGGADTVRNAGLVSGRLDLGAGVNAFVNESAGQLDAGSTLRLGEAGTLTNRGLLSPHGSRRIGTTALTGDFVQPAGGALVVDLDVMAGAADRIDVSGRADFAGRVWLLATRPAPATERIVIASAAAGMAARLDADAAPSAVAGYGLVVDGRDLVLDYRIDFSDVAGLNRNQRRFGAHVNAIQAAGGTAAFAPVADALFALPQATDLASAYDRLGAEPHVALATGTLLSSLQFGDAMLSCRRAEGEVRFVREGECGWAAATAGRLEQRRSDDAMGFVRSAGGASGGFQREVAPQWHVGAAFGVEHAVVDAGGIATTRGDQVQLGAMLKWRGGDTTVSAGVQAGVGSYEARRSAGFPVGGAVARSAPRLHFAGAHLRLAHALSSGDVYLRPLVDVGMTRVVQQAFDESGGGADGLSVRRSGQTHWTLRPALELGGDWRRSDGSLMRPYLRAGVLRRLSGAPQLQATLQGQPAGIGAFTVEGEAGRTMGELALGIDLFDAGGAVLRFGVSGQFSGRIDARSALLKMSMPF